MVAAKRKMHVFEVAVSFSALNKGDRFSQEPDSWTAQHVESGYLRDEGPGYLKDVEEAPDAGEVGQG